MSRDHLIIKHFILYFHNNHYSHSMVAGGLLEMS